MTIGRRVLPWLFAAACLCGYIYAYASGRAGVPIRSDGFSYYVYLPAWTLQHDPSLQATADDCCGGEFPRYTGINRWPGTERWVNAHPIGEAIMIAPFFAAAHALTRWTNLSPDGFSIYYQHGAGLAGLCYVLIGLWFCHRLLARYFSAGVVAATDVVLLFGTNLYHYATFDSVWSHAFSFALFSAFLERLDARTPGRLADDAVLGAISGLLILVRHTHVVIPICFFGADLLRTKRLPIVPAVVAALIVLPQLWVYHAATGHWLVSSYGELGFAFATNPHVADTLFGPGKGLFFYTPVLLAALPGAAWLPDGLRRWRLPAIGVLAINTYFIAAWFDWRFGASYGHRGFVDFFPLFAIGLAAAFARIGGAPRVRAAATVAAVGLCALSLFQMLQYWHGVLPMTGPTWPQYKSIFLEGWW